MTDFPPEGGCMNKCSSKMSCGHICPKICHANDRDHLFKCQESCTRFCPVNHPCPKKCFEDCNPCMERVDKKLPCTHAQVVLCYKDPSTEFCQTSVWKVYFNYGIAKCIITILFFNSNRSCQIAATGWIYYAAHLFLKRCVLKCVA